MVGLTFGGFGVTGTKNVLSLSFTLRTSTVCSLSVNAVFVLPAQLASTTRLTPSTGCVPSNVTAAAQDGALRAAGELRRVDATLAGLRLTSGCRW